jgi:hypothetical protein
VRPVFDRLFREYGLPNAIRTDNGVPFATTGIHGLLNRTGFVGGPIQREDGPHGTTQQVLPGVA